MGAPRGVSINFESRPPPPVRNPEYAPDLLALLQKFCTRLFEELLYLFFEKSY